jgi:SAM-dependent methyltransferase
MPNSPAQPMKSIDYWDKQPCGSLHPNPSWQRYYVQPHIPRFAEFPKWRDKRVLEIGCGIGTDTLQFTKNGAYVWAVDQSAKSVEISGTRCPDAVYNVVDAEQWLPHGLFDLIYSFGVLHHTPHPEKVLLLAHERLKDDGELRIMLYAKYSWKHLFTRQQPEAQAGCPHVKWYSEREAKELLESCGFRVVSIEKTHIFPWRIKDYIKHSFVIAFPWNVIPLKWFAWLESKLGHHLLIKAVKA